MMEQKLTVNGHQGISQHNKLREEIQDILLVIEIEQTHQGHVLTRSRHLKAVQERNLRNADKTTILAILETEPDYRPPRPMKPCRPPSSWYCEDLEDTGHTTDQYYQLSNLIESKIRKGNLFHYTESETHTHHEKHGDDDRIIDVIFGGHAVGGFFNNLR